MIKNLTRLVITILIFGFYLLASFTAMAQSATAPPETSDDGDRRDIGHQHTPEQPDDQMKNRPGRASAPDSKKSNPSGAKPDGSSGMDQKNPAGGTGGSKGY